MRNFRLLLLLAAVVALLLPPRWCCAWPGTPLSCCAARPLKTTESGTAACPKCRAAAQTAGSQAGSRGAGLATNRAPGMCLCQAGRAATVETPVGVLDHFSLAHSTFSFALLEATTSAASCPMAVELLPPDDLQARLCCWRI